MIDVLGALREGLAPHYTVEREIGAGGMARVFLAAERHPPRKVAVKVMNPEVSGSEFRERFIREVELTSRLSHPHIVPILAADECLFVPDGPDGLCYYVMPYIEGESLRARLEREQRLPLEAALRIALEVGDALSYGTDTASSIATSSPKTSSCPEITPGWPTSVSRAPSAPRAATRSPGATRWGHWPI